MDGNIQEAPCANVGKVFVSIAFLVRADSLPSDAVAGLPTPLCKEVAIIRESFVIDTKTLYLRHFALLAS